MRFEWYEILLALLGGAIMGVVASLNFYLYGKLIGLSSIIRGVFTCNSNNCKWQLPFFTGILDFVIILSHTKGYFRVGDHKYYTYLDGEGVFVNYISFIGMIIAGFLMGFGAGLSGGCTSDHSISGVPRCTKRSLFGMAVFIGVAMLASSLRYHLDIGNHHSYHYSHDFHDVWVFAGLIAVIVLDVFTVIYIIRGCRREGENKWQAVNSLLLGLLFGIGLMFSGTLRPTVISSFITLNKFWNPQLAFVFLGIFLVNFFVYRYVIKKERPVYGESLDVPEDTGITARLVIGSILFGFGWAMGLMAPGPACANFLIHPELMLYTPILVVCFIFTDWVVKKVTKSGNNGNESGADHEEAPLVS